jgi:teichoic acid transport system permease protein
MRRSGHPDPIAGRRLTVVRDHGRVSGGPGKLSGLGGDTELAGLATAMAVPEAAGDDPLPSQPLAALAAEYGLKEAAARPPILSYLADLWQRRHFIVGFATARNVAMYTEARLGQVWQVLTPLLNAAVYYLIFGVILGTKRGVPDFISFLVAGVFIFNFTQRSFIIASRVINDSLPLIRALYFPRAALPLGYVLIELEQLMVSMVVLVIIVLARGEPLTWYWLLVLPVLLLQAIFNVGAGLILARIGAGVDDVSQLLPFVVRTWMYTSGVMFSIQTLKSLTGHHKLAYILQVNPAAVYITLVRTALLKSQRLSIPGAAPYNHRLCTLYYNEPANHLYDSAHCAALVSHTDLWLYAVGWAVLALVIGFFYFWRAEARYGRG